MATLLGLDPAVQKHILRQARDRGFDAQALFRFHPVLAVASGKSRRCVAAVCSCAASTYVRAVERFERGGFEALRDQRSHNVSRKLSLAYLETLHAVLEHRAQDFGWQRPTWTRESLALTMAEQRFPLVSACTLGRALRQIGARRGRPKPTEKCPWPPKLRSSPSRVPPP